MFVPLKTQPETVKFVYFLLAQQLLDLQLFNSSLQGFLCPKKSLFLRKHQVTDPQRLQNLTFPFRPKSTHRGLLEGKRIFTPKLFRIVEMGFLNTRTNDKFSTTFKKNIGSSVVFCGMRPVRFCWLPNILFVRTVVGNPAVYFLLL